MLLTRSHPHRTGVLGQALKLGAKFISVWVRSLPFWRAAFTQYERDFRAAAERLQKGTKVLQVSGGHGGWVYFSIPVSNPSFPPVILATLLPPISLYHPLLLV
jgi:hypothetical protein